MDLAVACDHAVILQSVRKRVNCFQWAKREDHALWQLHPAQGTVGSHSFPPMVTHWYANASRQSSHSNAHLATKRCAMQWVSSFTAYLWFFQWWNLSSPSSAARTRYLNCTPDFCGSWLIWVCCTYSMFCSTTGTTYVQPMHLSCWSCLRGPQHSHSANSLPLAQPEQSECWQWEAGILVLACAKSYAETVHVQRHTCHYLSFICFAEGGVFSIFSSACRRATPYPALVIMWAHFGCTSSVQEVNCLKILPNKTYGEEEVLLNQIGIALFLKTHS